jgi:hypothetical protein
MYKTTIIPQRKIPSIQGKIQPLISRIYSAGSNLFFFKTLINDKTNKSNAMQV